MDNLRQWGNGPVPGAQVRDRLRFRAGEGETPGTGTTRGVVLKRYAGVTRVTADAV